MPFVFQPKRMNATVSNRPLKAAKRSPNSSAAATSASATAVAAASSSAAAVAAAAQAKNERIEKMRRREVAKQKKRDEQEKEAQFEAELRDKLSDDQVALFAGVRTQVKKELRKAKKDFAPSSARHEIMRLSNVFSGRLVSALGDYVAH